LSIIYCYSTCFDSVSSYNIYIALIFCVLGGAGGKGVWGKLGEESDMDAAIDMKDPNYDSDLLDDDNIVLREITPESSDEELKVIVQLLIIILYKLYFKLNFTALNIGFVLVNWWVLLKTVDIFDNYSYFGSYT